MVSIPSRSKSQRRKSYEQDEDSDVGCQCPAFTFLLFWLIIPVTFMISCIQRFTTHVTTYLFFPFLLEDLETEAPDASESTEVNNSKVHDTGSDIIWILLLAILWIRRKPREHKQDGERELASKAVLQLLHMLSVSTCGSSHMCCSGHLQYPVHAATSCPHFELVHGCCNQMLPLSLWLEGPRCNTCFQTTKSEPYFHSPCCEPCKVEDSPCYKSLWQSGEVPPISLSVYHQQDNTDPSAPESEGDETNSDLNCLAEGYFLPPPKEKKEVETWDEIDELGDEIEECTMSKITRKKAGKQIHKVRRSLEFKPPVVFKKKWRRGF